MRIPVGMAAIYEALGRIMTVARPTEIVFSDAFSKECGAQIYLKLENLQRTGSFKIRGAFNKISRIAEMPGSERPTGVIAVSAGNHAQGVASAAAYCRLPATVVMPKNASITKIRSCQESGAEVILHGDTLEDAGVLAKELAKERDLLFVHPYDDWDIIAGQATVGLEILKDLPNIDTVVVPLGGGGLLSGVSLAVKLQKPEVRIIGVQTEPVSPYLNYIKTGYYHTVQPGANTIADGIKVKSPGEKTSQVIRQYVDDVVVVDDNQISEAIVALLERTRTVVEGAGAVALAALLHHKIAVKPEEKVLAVISGGNIDMPLVGKIIDYGLVSSGRILALAVLLPDVPGQLYRLIGIISELQMNIREVEHRRGELHVPVGLTEVVLEVECRDVSQHQILLERLKQEGLKAKLLGG
jgi:threonine dehydratase